MIQLSILICSLESRIEKRSDLLRSLTDNLGGYYTEKNDRIDLKIERRIGKHVEIIICTDNGQMKVGQKRNLLLDQASGNYISFIDDDDMVSYLYVELLLEKIKLNPDVIVFDVARYQNGKPDRMVSYGIEYKRDFNTRDVYYRLPNHLMCVKKSLAQQVRFKRLNFGEDSDYAARMLPFLKHQERINQTLYAYYFDDNLSATAK